jgi:hypothetical protein
MPLSAEEVASRIVQGQDDERIVSRGAGEYFLTPDAIIA